MGFKNTDMAVPAMSVMLKRILRDLMVTFTSSRPTIY